MSAPGTFSLRSYDWWKPSRRRFGGDDATPFDPDLIFPVAGRSRPLPPAPKRSDR